MSKPGACVRCKEPVTNQTLLTCCKQPCHVACATQWRKSRGFYSDCFHCSQWRCFAVIEVLNEEWKEDPKFVEEVKRIWHHHPLWYGICYEFKGTIQRLWEGNRGFWGALDDVVDGNTKNRFSWPHPKRSHCKYETLQCYPHVPNAHKTITVSFL